MCPGMYDGICRNPPFFFVCVHTQYIDYVQCVEYNVSQPNPFFSKIKRKPKETIRLFGQKVKIHRDRGDIPYMKPITAVVYNGPGIGTTEKTA